MAKKRKVGNLLALAVLSYLSRGPLHPYELGRMLRANDDVRSIKFNHGALYMVFQQLAKAGFVEGQETSRQGDRPERTVYALTAAGADELGDWMRELIAEPQQEYPHFVAALSLIAALPPDEVVELLTRRLALLTERGVAIRDLIDTTLGTGVQPLFLVEEEYRLNQLDAEYAFVKRFIEQITHPKTGWGRQWAEFHSGPPATSDEGSTP